MGREERHLHQKDSLPSQNLHRADTETHVFGYWVTSCAWMSVVYQGRFWRVHHLKVARRSVGGQRMRWNDLLLRDLRNCNLDGVWRILAQDRIEWKNKLWTATQEVNFKKEEQEQYRKDEQKRRRETRQMASEFALHCSSDGCGFTAVNHVGLVNHQRQKHGQYLTSQCQYCHQTFSQQGLHNHERFCCQRTSTPLI